MLCLCVCVCVFVSVSLLRRRLYLAYTVFWAIGGLLAMQVRFIGSNHVTSHELLSFNMVWLGLQVRRTPRPRGVGGGEAVLGGGGFHQTEQVRHPGLCQTLQAAALAQRGVRHLNTLYMVRLGLQVSLEEGGVWGCMK
jgi:hypothetical protein